MKVLTVRGTIVIQCSERCRQARARRKVLFDAWYEGLLKLGDQMFEELADWSRSVSCISPFRGAAAPSRHRRASSPGEEAVGGLWSKFEPIRTASRDCPESRPNSLKIEKETTHRLLRRRRPVCVVVAGRRLRSLDAVRTAPKSKKKPPPTSSPGDDARRWRLHTTGRRERAFQYLQSPSSSKVCT